MPDHRNNRPRSASFTRRRALAGAAGLSTLALAPADGRAQSVVDLTFSFGPDPSGSTTALIEAFNAAHEGQIRVTWREMPEQTDQYREQLESDFLVGSGEIDVIGADVIWTAQFADQGWVEDVSRRFYNDYSADGFLPASIGSTAWSNRLWGVPWFAAAGLLYYRRDLLEASGFEGPPRTWEELKTQALKVKEDAGVAHGLVFQGGDYEGGVTNALEYLWSAGGRVMTQNITNAGVFGMNTLNPNVVTIKSDDSVRGFEIARSMMADGVAPEEVAEFNEQDAIDAFVAGDAVFMRNWPFAYALIGEPGTKVTTDQVGIAPIPTAREGGRHFSCLGGWNLMISRFSDQSEAAWTFIRYATSVEAQRMRALEGGFMPTLLSLYQDPEILDAVPVIAQAGEVFQETRNRPTTPAYPQISRRIAIVFNRVLRGELNGQEAVDRLQGELRTIVRRSR